MDTEYDYEEELKNKHPTEEQHQKSLNKLHERYKHLPNYKEKLEFGKLLLIKEENLSLEQIMRFKQLEELLIKNKQDDKKT